MLPLHRINCLKSHKTALEKSAVGLFINKFAGSFTSLSPSFCRTPHIGYLSKVKKHFPVQSQKWKHYSITWNLIKFKIKHYNETSFWCIHCELFTDFTYCSDVSIVYFELVNGDWELCSSYYPHKMRKSNMKFPFLIEQTQSSRRVLEKRCS